MAIVNSTILESIKGSVGRSSFYVREGEFIWRKKSSMSRKNTSPAMLERQLKFKTIGALGAQMLAALRMGFPVRPWGWTPVGMFMNRNKGIVTVDDVTTGKVTVSFPDLVCAEGGLEPPTVNVSREANQLTFTVTSTEESPYSATDDTIQAVVVQLEKRPRCIMQTLGTRGEGGISTMNIPTFLQGGALHVYVFAASADRKKASDSIYLPLE